jgi:hypothetical protein
MIHAQRNLNVPAMSVLKTGRLSWNAALHRALGEPPEVMLFYDEDAGRLGLKPGPGFRVYAVGKRQQQHLIACERALGQLGLTPDASFREPAEDCGGGLWAIALPPVDGEGREG